MKVFSIKKFKESLKNLYTKEDIEEFAILWANECEGKTEEELLEMNLGFNDAWMIEKEESKKINLKVFFNSDEKMAIHCDTFEKAYLLLKAFDKLGMRWYTGESYLFENEWSTYFQVTCYTNDRKFGPVDLLKEQNIKIYEFEEVDIDE